MYTYHDITVSDILEYLARGTTEEKILEDFPKLTPIDIRAYLTFSAEYERELTSAIT